MQSDCEPFTRTTRLLRDMHAYTSIEFISPYTDINSGFCTWSSIRPVNKWTGILSSNLTARGISSISKWLRSFALLPYYNTAPLLTCKNDVRMNESPTETLPCNEFNVYATENKYNIWSCAVHQCKPQYTTLLRTNGNTSSLWTEIGSLLRFILGESDVLDFICANHITPFPESW